jgi:hypothetical protein
MTDLLAPLTKLFEQPVSPLDQLDQFAEGIAKRPTPEPRRIVADDEEIGEWGPEYEIVGTMHDHRVVVVDPELVRKRAAAVEAFRSR